MCKREDVRQAQEAQDAAADALTHALNHACKGLCSDNVGEALKSLYDTTVREPVPVRFSQLVGRLQ